ncbi:MAG: hypothetical protein A3J65_01755 [Candidatus Buchananbacteria bacterium RIFCSPHIGHO2_02_FULL_45_11b]|uniref:Uncharacterized protein n=3 Tax=Candidatus Buchananiibacteriota TaxID=1817903 RepID=A0A1G1Y3C6_9BACT|nr:MAG: hypothetical protein A2663_04320 [Candidatus Buchananbacteria bacterium RIFCSPHIGHO2_01_FULL_46_12]OGY51101.1 MAG: hypothetical protein A3J65_01755 [Candidatus Buchananbacteria bacterium RIFCSPHIGHO2_02_FULL_45_11b]OGY58285.1 MAG: hypothetical protein A3H67_01270 [Candidatus Buchananbacteria bacterium RIFCSPLOWO2_02_FULL_46_11b]
MEKNNDSLRTWEVYRRDNGAPEFVGRFLAKSKSHAVRLAVVNSSAELLEPYGAGQLSAKPVES